MVINAEKTIYYEQDNKISMEMYIRVNYFSI